jgi:uncharacterized protein YndB with AHSA1/START domain
MEMAREAQYAQPPEKVWHALTDREALGRIFAETDFEPVEGRRFQFRAKPRPGWDGIINGRVTKVEPNRRLAYEFQGSRMKTPTNVTWELEPSAGGTRLRLVHSGFRGLGQRLLALVLDRGWKRMMEQDLRRYLEGSTS